MLAQKLQLKPGMRYVVVNGPDGFSRALGKVPAGATPAPALRGELDLVLIFTRDSKQLGLLWPKALKSLKGDGVLWVAYPKKSSGITSDLAGMNTWELTRGSPWQPVSSISIDDTWSAVRFRHAPGLDQRRAERQDEVMRDADGTVCIDRMNRTVTAPRDLMQLFKKAPKANALFETLSFTHRREYVQWILEAKRPETRAQRLSKTVEKLSQGKRNPTES